MPNVDSQSRRFAPRGPGFFAAAKRAFTLIELLVVIAVIALLVGLLLPALGSAREEARAIRCAASLKSVADGVAAYQATYKSFYPLAYTYSDPLNLTGNQYTPAWSEQFQGDTIGPNQVYVHWSYSVMADSDGKVAEEAWKCPSLGGKGGAPATNPEAEHSEAWQGVSAGTTRVDFQAKRIAYTGNAAIFSRNKVGPLVSSPRKTVYVNDSVVELASKTILATEFYHSKQYGWEPLQAGAGDSNVGEIKSHRPITAIVGGSTGSDLFGEPTVGQAQYPFFYPKASRFVNDDEILPGSISNPQLSGINLVGRTHSAKNERRKSNAAANFSFVDGHVERMTPVKTLEKRLWGERVYSVSGQNRIHPTETAD